MLVKDAIVRRSLGAHTFLAALLIALAVVTACGQQGPRSAERTLRATALDLPPPMHALAPAAETLITNLRAPESVLYDAQQDVYFISNINGGLLDADDNGFISRVDAANFNVNLKWVESGRNGVHLDAPKGMTVVGDTLYVTDIAGVRKFDRRSGAPQGIVALPGAVLINDLTTDGTNVYASDTGLRTGAGRAFIDSGTSAIWKITNDRAEKIASGAELLHPNGLDWVNGKLWAVSFGGLELYSIDGGKKKDVATLPRGELDGLVHLADGTFLISSWRASEVFRGPAGGPFEPILGGINAPADLGYDTKRHRLLVPRSGTNDVTVHHVP